GVFQPVRVVGVRIGFTEPAQVDRDRLHLVEGGVGVGFTQRQDVRCQAGGRIALTVGAGGLGVAGELVLRVDLVVDGFQRLGAGRAGIDRGATTFYLSIASRSVATKAMKRTIRQTAHLVSLTFYFQEVNRNKSSLIF